MAETTEQVPQGSESPIIAADSPAVEGLDRPRDESECPSIAAADPAVEELDRPAGSESSSTPSAWDVLEELDRLQNEPLSIAAEDPAVEGLDRFQGESPSIAVEEPAVEELDRTMSLLREAAREAPSPLATSLLDHPLVQAAVRGIVQLNPTGKLLLCLCIFFVMIMLVFTGKARWQTRDLARQGRLLEEQNSKMLLLERRAAETNAAHASRVSEFQALLHDAGTEQARIEKESERQDEVLTRWCFHSVLKLQEKRLVVDEQPHLCIPQEPAHSHGDVAELQKLLRRKDAHMDRLSREATNVTTAVVQHGLKLYELKKQLQEAQARAATPAPSLEEQLVPLRQQRENKAHLIDDLRKALQGSSAALDQLTVDIEKLTAQAQDAEATAAECPAQLENRSSNADPSTMLALREADKQIAQLKQDIKKNDMWILIVIAGAAAYYILKQR